MSANSEMMRRQGISEFFSGKNILITGATGFIGKSLLEKLLRSCPDIGTIYIITRPKRGKTLSQRIADIIKNPLYDRLKEEQPDLIFEHRIKPLAGDIQELNLGLCDEDRTLIRENVHLIFHMAATVRFDESLKKTILLNVRGTREMCQIALNSERLEVIIIGISTSLTVLFNVHSRKLLTQKYLWHKVTEYAAGLCSPGVTASLREPICGWVDNFYGVNGLLAVIRKGVLRTMYIQGQCKLDFIPVDVVSKSVVVCAWDLVQRANTSEVEVMQCTAYSATWLRQSVAQLISYGVLPDQIPSNNVIWLPGVHITNNCIIYYIRTAIFLCISLLVDGLLKVPNNKPRLQEIQKKIFIGQDSLRHFGTNEWTYPDGNLLELQERILVKDRDDWDYEFTNYNTTVFSQATILAVRRYLFHETDDTLPNAKRHHRMLYWIDALWNAIYWFLVYIFLRKIGVFERTMSFL